MHLGIFAKTFPRPTLEGTLDATTDRGLTHVQFNMSCAGLPTLPERIDEDFCRSIARAFHERGLTMAAISGTFNLCDPDASQLAENLDRLDRLAAACRWLDTRIITLCTGTRDPKDMWRWHPENVRRSSWDSMIESIRRAVQIADHHEVTLAFEPELNNVVNSVSKARRLLDEIGSPWLKVVIDPANLAGLGELIKLGQNVDEAFDWLGPDIVLAHVKQPEFNETDVAMWNDYKLRAVHRVTGDEVIGLFIKALDVPSKAEDQWAKDIEMRAITERGQAELIRMMEFLFYRPYLSSLREAGYSGALILHGLDENEVEGRTASLRRIMGSFAAGG